MLRFERGVHCQITAQKSIIQTLFFELRVCFPISRESALSLGEDHPVTEHPDSCYPLVHTENGTKALEGERDSSSRPHLQVVDEIPDRPAIISIDRTLSHLAVNIEIPSPLGQLPTLISDQSLNRYVGQSERLLSS